jgi:hypothetical protein
MFIRNRGAEEVRRSLAQAEQSVLQVADSRHRYEFVESEGAALRGEETVDQRSSWFTRWDSPLCVTGYSSPTRFLAARNAKLRATDGFRPDRRPTANSAMPAKHKNGAVGFGQAPVVLGFPGGLDR